VPSTRSAEVPATRFAGWVDRFGAGHGGSSCLLASGGEHRPRAVLQAADGASAELDAPFEPPSGWPDLEALLTHVAAVGASQPYVLLLVRRGGWAVARCAGERVLASRVRTRYVQGRTKKGGSSQQRYARRRGNQADAVVAAAVAAAVEVWGAAPHRAGWTVLTGGDRLLLGEAVELLLRRAPLRVAARHLDVPDPRRGVLDTAARSACAVRVRVTDPGTAH